MFSDINQLSGQAEAPNNALLDAEFKNHYKPMKRPRITLPPTLPPPAPIHTLVVRERERFSTNHNK